MLTAALTSTATSSRPFVVPSETRTIPVSNNNNNNNNNHVEPDTSHIRIVPHLDSSRSLVFSVIERDVAEGTILKIGRFTDKYASSTRITFKSKVVSRGHAEIWSKNGKFYIRDTKSSSGTFLNHVRLSPPNQESRSFLLNDNDVVQLGVDYQGGTEEIYRCVKMRLEINRSTQQRTTFSLNTFQSLRNLTTPPNNVTVLDSAMTSNNTNTKLGNEEFHVEECCICLYALAPFQSLFVGPCSHTFHYKCARPLLMNHPGFLCPLCRNYADLDASVAVEASEVLEMYKKEKEQQQQQQQTNTSPILTNDDDTKAGDTVTQDPSGNPTDPSSIFTFMPSQSSSPTTS
ncbi:SMAD/FHA domain-containing protein [Halteromyces radiatus]|uniref:SMAD/FHA domain-containing protein n=1 Tax=Halteromyces radiatus TaxID=101107 RepID=UPI00221FBB95|nr:SMAD/FHA domain-containing protein [Halteromyces radiatus]KAI8077823.1 SMAD/FHA domain-containing protein [Halteromyces radiatus]